MHESEASRVLCLGEALGVLRTERHNELATTNPLWCSVGGAEANVAGTLAALGIPTTWLSRLGADPFGDFVIRDLTDRGVRVVAERDDERPTGLYLKESTPAGTRMHYYRSGSAATALRGDTLAEPGVQQLLAECDIVHTSGITAGIIAEDSDLLRQLAEYRDEHGFLLTVDLNWRQTLWHGKDHQRLLDLLSTADVVLLGADEAETVLGTAEPERLREFLGERPRLVMKTDSREATEIDPAGGTTTVPALRVEVVEPVGAGDGFAAGYLAALLDGQDSVRRLRQGHLIAASVLAESGDHAPPPETALLRALLDADTDEWRASRVTPAGFTSPAVTDTGGVG